MAIHNVVNRQVENQLIILIDDLLNLCEAGLEGLNSISISCNSVSNIL